MTHLSRLRPLVVTVDLPTPEVCRAILLDTLRRIAQVYPQAASLQSDPLIAQAADRAVGLDGRRIRKATLSSLAHSKQIAANPDLLTAQAVLEAIEHAQAERSRLEAKP